MDESNPKFDLSKLATAKGAKSFQPEAGATRKRRRLDLHTWTPLLIVLVGTAVLAGVYLVPLLEPVHEANVQPVVVEQDAEQRRTTTALLASGWVEPDPFPTRINPQVMGVVQHVFVVEGDRLMRIDTFSAELNRWMRDNIHPLRWPTEQLKLGTPVVAQLDTTLIEREIAVVEAHIEYDRRKIEEIEAKINQLEMLKGRNFDARLRVARLERDLAALRRAKLEAEATLESAMRKRDQNAEARMSYVHHRTDLAKMEEQYRRFLQEKRMIEARLPYLQERAAALRENAEADAVTELEAIEAETAFEEATQRLEGYRDRQESMQATLDATRETYEVARELLEQPEDLDADVRSARATLAGIAPQIESLEAELRVAREDDEDPLELRTDIEVQQAGIVRLEYEIKEATAMLAQLLERKRLHTVFSTVDGEVLEVPTEPGSMLGTLSEAHAIVTAFDPQRIQVRVYLPLADVPAVEVGQRVEITSDAVRGHTYEGVVTRFVRRASLERNALQVKIEVLNPDGGLKPDMLTRCRFLPIVRDRAETSPDVVQVLRFYVPRSALASTPEGEGIYVYDPRGQIQGEGSAHLVLVTSHEDAVAPEGHIEVEGPLQRGQRVIDSPPSGLRNGSRVRPR